MTKDDIVALLDEIPDDEPLFLVRGSVPASRETLHEYARQCLYYGALTDAISARAQKAARDEADRAQTLAQEIREKYGDIVALAEAAAGLTAANPEQAAYALRDASIEALKAHGAPKR